MIQPSGYTNNIGLRAKTVNTATAVPVNKEIVSSKPAFKGNNSTERKHISYWRSLGISSVFGLSAAGFATIFAQKWRTAAGFGSIIAGLMMFFDLPDTFFIGKK